MSESFDASIYVRAPVINIANGVTLANTLVGACPPTPPLNVVKSCARLKATADAAQTALAVRRRENGAVSDDDARVLDREADGSFGAMRMRLIAYSMLPVARFPRARRAAEIEHELFGSDGLQFLTAEYPVQNTTMAAIVQHIDEANLRPELAALAGPEFLEQIDNVLPRYHAMVQGKLLRDNATDSLMDHVRALQAAIVDYANKVSGMVDDDDPESIAVVKKALRPIDAHRELHARRAQPGARNDAPSAAPDDAGAPGDSASPGNTAAPTTPQPA